MMLAGVAACICMLMGLMQKNRLCQQEREAAAFARALESLLLALQLSSAPLPLMLRECAPEEGHFFHRLGCLMEEQPALSPKALLDRLSPPPCLPKDMAASLVPLLECLSLPRVQEQQQIMGDILTLWKREAESAREIARQKGRLTVKLGLLGGCALFILLC